jgi:hypothetical protein
MKATAAAQRFFDMSEKEKICFLSRLGWELTMVGRDAYAPQTEELTHPARLRAINEIQHRIFSHLYSMSSHDTQRYPDDVLVAILLEESPDRVLKGQVQAAFDRAAEFIERNPA